MSEKGFTITVPVHIKQDRRARRVVRQGPAPESPPEAVPRIARLLALAHKWEGMVRRGEVKDHAEVSRRTGLTRSRVAQICGLRLLAPDIQELALLSECRVPTHVFRWVSGLSSWTLQQRRLQDGVPDE